MSYLAGLDEVGRGAFAGPLVAGCVVFEQTGFSLSSRLRSQKDENLRHVRIDDSKKLTAKQREVSAKWIKKNAITWGIGKATSKYIDKFGLTRAENYCFRQAVRNAEKRSNIKIDKLIIDAFFIPYLKGIPRNRQMAIKKADSKSKSVAAASIIAKVYRDKLMSTLAQNPHYQKYKWDENKGYGTKSHRESIAKYGTTSYHRKLFLGKDI